MQDGYPHDLLTSSVAELLLRHDLHLVVVDDADQLDESGIALFCALAPNIGCSFLFLGNKRLLRMRFRPVCHPPLLFARGEEREKHHV